MTRPLSSRRARTTTGPVQKLNTSTDHSDKNKTHVREDDLELYAIGTLEEWKVPTVKAHVKTCPYCGNRLLEIATFTERIAELTRPRRTLDRRCEVRLLTEDPGFVRCLRPQVGPRYDARILDVSKRGLRVEVPIQIDTGVEIQVQLKDSIAFAEVRYCRPVADKFHLGAKVVDVVVFSGKSKRQN